MDIDLVLNELSLRTPADSIFVARNRMSALLRTIVSATKAGASRTLRTHRELNDELLATDYPVSRWRNDREVDREEQRLFRSLSSKAPFLVDLPDKEKETFGIECSCDGETANGFGVAWLLELYPLSLLSSPRWDSSQVDLVVAEFDADGEVVQEIVSLAHASRPEHISLHRSWFDNRLALARNHVFQEMTSSRELWDRREQLFARLRFCDEVERQLEDIDREAQMLRPVLKRLFEFEQYCAKWESGPFDPDSLPSLVSPESRATLDLFGSERIFRYMGQARQFSWHARLTPGTWRIYFEPDMTDHVFYIGYIGKHLPTVKYRTF